MTYLINRIRKTSPNIFEGSLSHTGSTALGDYLTFDTPRFNNTANTSRAGDTLTLTSGYFLIVCSIGVNNSDDIANNLSYKIEVDGVLLSNSGNSTKDNKCGIDSSVLDIDVPAGSSKAIKIKIIDQNGVTTINSDYTSLYIQEVQL